MELRCDAIVVGAGAAGLAAARILSRAGRTAVVLEARERLGGRILTREDAGLTVPAELGGEFIHGTADVSFDLVRAARTVAVDTGEESFVFEDGELRTREDPFATVGRVVARASGLRDDVSVEQFLRDMPDGGDVDRERRATRMMVEGFDAADPHRASIRALAEEWNGAEGGQTSEQFRPLGGYAQLVRTLFGALDPERVHVRLGAPVAVIRRDPSGVAADATSSDGTRFTVRARAAIVTVPVGVLKANGVRFEPALPQRTRDALACIVMGPVVKLALRFRTAFWERVRDGRFRNGAFFHRAEAAFPAFWTQVPLRSTLMIAWAGGPKADALAGRDQAALVATALADLRVLFGEESDPHGELEAAYGHDWQNDPFARGAYSYLAVGGTGARETLGQPVDGALFFAGEATAPASEAGTVAGALQQGERAARDVLAALLG